MPAKIIFDDKKDVPEHLQGEAKEAEGGKYEVDASGLLNKNRELLKDNARLKADKETLQADKEAVEAQRDEYKGKAKIPSGQKLVSEDVAELGEAAKEAGLVKDEIPTLKTAKEDLQAKLDETSRSLLVGEVAKRNGYNEKFVEMAKDKKLNFETIKEKDGDADVDVDYVLETKDGQAVKTKVPDFVKNDSFFSLFADTFTSESGGKPYPEQKPGDKSKGVGETGAQSTIASRYGGTIKAMNAN